MFRENEPIGRVTSLDVWVDSQGVIRQMHLTSRMHVTTNGREKFVVVKNGTVKAETLGPPVPVRHGVERASAFISFLDIGEPQKVTAPAHAILVYGHG